MLVHKIKEVREHINLKDRTVLWIDELVVDENIDDRLNVLCAIDEESRGVKKGSIVEPAETEYAIKKILKRSYIKDN